MRLSKTASIFLLVSASACLVPLVGGCPDGTPIILPGDVHLFRYDPLARNYEVGENRINEARVRQDLCGNLCGKCHSEQVAEVMDSVHYQWRSTNDRVLFPGGGAHGMIDRACGLPASAALVNYTADVNLDECGQCHVGRFLPIMQPAFESMLGKIGAPNPGAQAKRIVEAGLDCLICHSESYRSFDPSGNARIANHAPSDARSPTQLGSARASHDDTDFDGDGQPDLLIDMDGDGTPDAPLMQDRDGDGTPETPWPTIAQDRSVEAVATIGKTTDHTCLRCHEHARTGYKRGTLFRKGHDVHATSAVLAEAGGGEDRHCVACHTASHHKFKRGDHVGGDLMASDYPIGSEENSLECTSCHTASSLPQDIHFSQHMAVMSCETCHIPATSGITYSLWGHGTNLTFGRNKDGRDTLLITKDHYSDDGTDEDVNTDWEAYRTFPTLMWYDGNVSFLAQSLAVRGAPGAKLVPFKPMANGMVFDGRFFGGEMMANEAMGGAYQYNAHSMYRFQAGGSNADLFGALGFFTLTPSDVRNVTLNDFFSTDPNRQAMALMQIFPNMVLFEKSKFGTVRYSAGGAGAAFDADKDGFLDVGAGVNLDMLMAANAGLQTFQGFNGPLNMPADYQWYPPFDNADDLISMKLPDGTLIKMFLAFQGMNLPAGQQTAFFKAIEEYPAYSNGVTLGGHGVRPKGEALGAGVTCRTCHAAGGFMDHPVPVTNTAARDVPGMGTLNFPVYRWRYYNIHALTDLGLTTTDEEIVAGTKSVDIAGDETFVRESSSTMVVNYLNPAGEGSYRKADHADSLAGTELKASDLTYNGGAWMPALEPVVHYVPNYRVLGYEAKEILFLD